jgi:hypothetical protein
MGAFLGLIVGVVLGAALYGKIVKTLSVSITITKG